MVDSILEWFSGIVSDVIEWLLSLVVACLKWLGEFVLWLGEKLWELLLAGLATFLEALPVPEFMSSLSGFLGQLPPMVVFFLHYFAVSEGLGFIASALVLRFILRRIPLIG